MHREVVGGSGRVEHEILQPRVQIYGNTAIVTYTLLIRTASYEGVTHQSHNETRVFHNFGSEEEQAWKLVHCHKSPVATGDSLTVLRA